MRSEKEVYDIVLNFAKTDKRIRMVILEVIVKIGIHIIITESGQTISVFQNFIKLPGFVH